MVDNEANRQTTKQMKSFETSRILGQRVTVKCPAYYNGRKFTGLVKSVTIDGLHAAVIIDGNKKATKFSVTWITDNASYQGPKIEGVNQTI